MIENYPSYGFLIVADYHCSRFGLRVFPSIFLKTGPSSGKVHENRAQYPDHVYMMMRLYLTTTNLAWLLLRL